VTTIDAAAAWHVPKRLVPVALAAFLGAGIAGCETSNNVHSSAAPGEPQAVASPAPSVQAQPRVAVARVMGNAPDAVARQLSTQLSDALEKQRIAVAKAPIDKADYTLRGYVFAAREKTGIKVGYVWDVMDPSGKRVNRINGEELVGTPDARDPWAAVTPKVVQAITGKTAASLGVWLPNHLQAAIANTQSTAATGALPAPTALASAAATTTGSLGREASIVALVPSVTGAPGDGAVSLTGALQQELSRNGIALADGASPMAYRVEGKVTMGAGRDGRQPIQIDWHVKDPQGKRLGTVSQKNDIPQGSLDGSWGKTADAAAAAAAQGILKLLPQPTSSQ
jgi:hypothetical protein